MSAPSVPRLFPGSTIVVLGTGPSLCAEDVDACRASMHPVVAISDSCRLAPWAPVIYSPDERWWHWHPAVAEFPAQKYSLQQTKFATVTRLAPGRKTVIERDPRFLSTGGHGGWQAINLAVHLGAARLVLLGYDFQPAEDGRQHFFGAHPDGSHVRYAQWVRYYLDLSAQLSALGITIVNVSRQTAIRGVPQVSLLEGLRPFRSAT